MGRMICERPISGLKVNGDWIDVTFTIRRDDFDKFVFGFDKDKRYTFVGHIMIEQREKD